MPRLGLGLALMLLLHASAPVAGAATGAPAVDALAREWREWLARERPEQASPLGWGGDAKLSRPTEASLAADAAWLNDFTARAAAVPAAGLPLHARIDRDVLVALAGREAFDIAPLERWRRDPEAWVARVADAVRDAMTRETTGSCGRVRRAAARLAHVPETLRGARVLLASPSRPATERAIALAEETLAEWRTDLPTLLAPCREPEAHASFIESDTLAIAALAQFTRELREDLLPRAVAARGVGREALARWIALETGGGGEVTPNASDPNPLPHAADRWAAIEAGVDSVVSAASSGPSPRLASLITSPRRRVKLVPVAVRISPAPLGTRLHLPTPGRPADALVATIGAPARGGDSPCAAATRVAAPLLGAWGLRDLVLGRLAAPTALRRAVVFPATTRMARAALVDAAGDSAGVFALSPAQRELLTSFDAWAFDGALEDAARALHGGEPRERFAQSYGLGDARADSLLAALEFDLTPLAARLMVRRARADGASLVRSGLARDARDAADQLARQGAIPPALADAAVHQEALASASRQRRRTP